MKRLISSWIVFVLFCAQAQAQAANFLTPRTLEDAEKLDYDDLRIYHQDRYQLEDPAGDYAMLAFAEAVPNLIFQELTGQERKPKKHKVSNDEPYEDTAPVELSPAFAGTPHELFEGYCHRHPIEAAVFLPGSMGLDDDGQMRKLMVAMENIGKPIQGRQSPILRDGFKRMFAQVIAEESAKGIRSSYGTPHQWSSEFLAKYRERSTMLASSKVLVALALGETSRYMMTEKEPELYRWIMSQPDSGVTIPELFRKSYQLNGGDVYKTLLTIENVLAHQWKNPKRELFPQTQKLKPITSGHEYREDRFGTWYHLFGIMLYGYVKGGMKAHAIGHIEALGSKILSPKVDKTQKAHINKDGGFIGADLAELVRERAYEEHESDPAYLDEASYLNRKEDFRDRIHVPLSPHVSAWLDKLSDPVFVGIQSPKKDLHNCIVELMPDTGRGFDSSQKDVSGRVSIGSQPLMLQVFSRSVQKVRGFITCAGSRETLVFEAR